MLLAGNATFLRSVNAASVANGRSGAGRSEPAPLSWREKPQHNTEFQNKSAMLKVNKTVNNPEPIQDIYGWTKKKYL